MPKEMSKEDREVYRTMVRELLEECLHYLDVGSDGHLPWRLVDAAGLMADAMDAWQHGNTGGVTMPTGRGYQLVQARAPEVKVRRVR